MTVMVGITRTYPYCSENNTEICGIRYMIRILRTLYTVLYFTKEHFDGTKWNREAAMNIKDYGTGGWFWHGYGYGHGDGYRNGNACGSWSNTYRTTDESWYGDGAGEKQ